MGNLINIDQTAAVPGRSILDNVHLLRNVLDYSSQKQLKCILLSLDQSKAFDRVDHSFMFGLLSRYGFGNDFNQWVKLLYFDIKSVALVNGFFTDIIHVNRSVRQGCSLSPLLYVLCIEPFANIIRLDTHISGFKTPGYGNEIRISQYADDCTFIVLNTLSISKILNICELYGLASGAKLNKEKSWGVWIGNWGNMGSNLFGIQWTFNNLKICGIQLGNGNFIKETWEKILTKFEKVINLNKLRNLRLYGKSVLLNSLGMSKLWYAGSVLPLPTGFLQKFQSRAFKFIWSDKTEYLKREVLYNACQEGGLNLTDINSKIKAFSIFHLIDFLFGSYRKWMDFTMYWLRLDLRSYLSNHRVDNRFPTSLERPMFYKIALNNFKEFLKLNPNADLKNLKVKNIYNVLLEKVVLPPRVRRVYPLLDFSEAFHNNSISHLSPESRNITFKIIHEILPVNEYLYCLNITKNLKCTLCNIGGESLHHLFYKCAVVNPIWDFIQLILFKISKDTVEITAKNILFNIFQKSNVTDYNIIFIILLAEARWSIWLCRNKHRFKEATVNYDYIKNVFVHNIRLRIKADFKRLPLVRFERLWANNSFFLYS